MVRCINVHNVNQGLAEGLRLLAHSGVSKSSRNGPVIRCREPVITTYTDPTARVLFSPLRDANPFFHVMEALWMLAGRNDLPWLAQFNKNMLSYSDDGGRTQPGAYGYRWRKHFGYDQLNEVVARLAGDNDDRRTVLAMWDAGQHSDPGEYNAPPIIGDLINAQFSADVPCNTHAYFEIQDGKLNMTVLCRSNDIWWGAYGANAVHFSFLLEYVAAMVGVDVGVYNQFSNNFHIYPGKLPGGAFDAPHRFETLQEDARHSDQYTEAAPAHTPRNIPRTPALLRVPLVSDPESFNDELNLFMAGWCVDHTWKNQFFKSVARPMWDAWQAFKMGDFHAAEKHAESIKAGDWSIACCDWLERRNQKRLAKLRNGVG